MTIVEIVTTVGVEGLLLAAWSAWVLGAVIELRDRDGGY